MKLTPFRRAAIAPSESEKVIADLLRKWGEGDPAIAQALGNPSDIGEADEKAREIMERIASDPVFRNDTHQVTTRDVETPLGPIRHLSIKRLDRSPIHDWRELQAVKSTLLGDEVEGVELYPAESRVVDSANQYHLWCAPPGVKWPFGFDEGRIVTEDSIADSVQRPFAVANVDPGGAKVEAAAANVGTVTAFDAVVDGGTVLVTVAVSREAAETFAIIGARVSISRA